MCIGIRRSSLTEKPEAKYLGTLFLKAMDGNKLYEIAFMKN
jgi:hypothetical protein